MWWCILVHRMEGRTRENIHGSAMRQRTFTFFKIIGRGWHCLSRVLIDYGRVTFEQALQASGFSWASCNTSHARYSAVRSLPPPTGLAWKPWRFCELLRSTSKSAMIASLHFQRHLPTSRDEGIRKSRSRVYWKIAICERPSNPNRCLCRQRQQKAP